MSVEEAGASGEAGEAGELGEAVGLLNRQIQFGAGNIALAAVMALTDAEDVGVGETGEAG